MRRLFYAIVFAIGITPAAHAIDFNQTIKTFDDKDFIDQDGKPAPQVLGTVAENSLLQTAPGDSIDEKNKRFWLAFKIHQTPKDPNLTAEEVSMIKKAIGTYQPIAIMGQALRLIDPGSVPKN
jgi:hypothetical protein